MPFACGGHFRFETCKLLGRSLFFIDCATIVRTCALGAYEIFSDPDVQGAARSSPVRPDWFWRPFVCRSKPKRRLTRMSSFAAKPRVADALNAELEMLTRVALRLTGNHADAEDAVGQTLVIAYEKWDQFDGRYLRSWLIQILRNEWLQVVRKRKSRGEVQADLVQEPADEFWMAIDRKLEAEEILNALAALDDDYRMAVTLCDVEQMSYEEAASALAVPLGTLQSRLYRARKQLRARLVRAQGIKS